MRKIHNFALTFKNSIGLVSSVSKHIYKNDGNILSSNMIKKGNSFDFNIIASIPKNKDNIFNNFEFDSLKQNSSNENQLRKIKVYCTDNSGIIHSTSQIIEKLDGDIIKLVSNVENAPISSIPLFSLEMDFYVNNISEENLENNFSNMKEKYNCEIDIL